MQKDNEIISRGEAKALGLKHYFTGKPCKKGGVGPRLVSNGHCKCGYCREAELELKLRWCKENRDIIAERNRRWREDNPEYQRQYCEENREAIAERKRQYREENREAIAKYKSRSRKSNRDVSREQERRYRENNPEKIRAKNAKRDAAKLQAVPSWFGELDEFVLLEAYELTDQRLADTGIEWHVDHMVPLQARKASGLHCADNIQVIPAAMNLRKINKMVLTQPREWLMTKHAKRNQA